MKEIFTIIIVGISLSMDAFSLSLVYGLSIYKMKDKILLAIIVGIYHFLMPLFGVLIGDVIISNITVSLNIIVFITFLAIGIDMTISGIKGVEKILLSGIMGFIIFGFSVSIDSFVTGIGLNVISDNHLIVSSIFCILSGFFTFVGLNLGSYLSTKFGKYALIGGGLMLITLSFSYLII